MTEIRAEECIAALKAFREKLRERRKIMMTNSTAVTCKQEIIQAQIDILQEVAENLSALATSSPETYLEGFIAALKRNLKGGTVNV